MAANVFLKLLIFKQKQRRMDIAQEMLTMFNGDPDLFKRVKTVDETCYYIETKAQSSQCKHPEDSRPWCIMNSFHKLVW